MKKTILFFCVCIFSFTTAICQEGKVSDEVSKELFNDVEFPKFAQALCTHVSDYLYYHTPIAEKGNDFIAAIKTSSQNDDEISKVYRNFGLDFDKSMDMRSNFDNDVLQILMKYRSLSGLPAEDVLPTLIAALDMGMNSDESTWKEVQSNIVNSVQLNMSLNGENEKHLGSKLLSRYKLSIDEVWGCIKGALGLGAGSIISIAGLNAAMHEGVQVVVRTVSAWLAKRVGWIGLALTLIDASVCIYKEYQD